MAHLHVLEYPVVIRATTEEEPTVLAARRVPSTWSVMLLCRAAEDAVQQDVEQPRCNQGKA